MATMKRYPILLGIGLFLLRYATPVSADPTATPSPTVEAQIRAVDREERDAVLAGDISKLERLWSPDIVVNNPQSGITPTREALLQRVRDGKIHYSSFERSIEAMRASGDDLVIVMGSEKVVPAAPVPGTGQVVLRRFTDLWKRLDGRWTLIARHANVIPNTVP